MTQLVIKLGALGDFCIALGAMKAIRDKHKDERLVLLTRKPYVGLAEGSGFFDEIWLDPQPKGNLADWWRWLKKLRSAGFDRVYDLQNSDRTALYALLNRACGGPRWCGRAWAAEDLYDYPSDHRIHITERYRRQLATTGIDTLPDPDLSFLGGVISGLELPERFCLFVPGSSANREIKRWPLERYLELAERTAARGITPVVIGLADSSELAARIKSAEPSTIDLTAKTDLGQFASLARKAAFTIGNDTGPVHMAAILGCPTVNLFSAESIPERMHPVGPRATIVHDHNIRELPVERVEDAILRICNAGDGANGGN